MCDYVADAATEFPISFTVIVVAASLSFIAVLCLLILTSSSYRRCCRPTLTSGTRTAGRPALQSISAGVMEPRLVGFTTVRGAGNHDRVNKTFRYTDDGGTQSAADHEYQRRRQTEHAQPTSARVECGHKLQRRDDDGRTPAVSGYLDTRSVSVPVIVDSRTDHSVTDHRRRTVADRAAGMTTTAVSTRVDSGVSGMQSSVCTLTSSATQQEPPADLGVEAGEWSREQFTNCVDAAVCTSPVWNLSQMSMDVRSCPGGTAGTSCVSLLPPLYLYQYVNGYSDAMLMHIADRRPRSSLHSSNISHVASTTATHYAADVAAEESRHCDDDTQTVPSPRGGLTVQTAAIVEPRRMASSQDDQDSPCVCGQSHDDLPPFLDQDLPPPPDDISAQLSDLSPSTATARDLSLQHHFPPPPSSVCGHPHLELRPPTNCDHQRPIELLDSGVNVIKATTSSEIERRCLLTRLLLGYGDELTLSPVYIDETYF